ncbi:hypothetical protein ACLOJK_020844 [Asimina triloba]
MEGIEVEIQQVHEELWVAQEYPLMVSTKNDVKLQHLREKITTTKAKVVLAQEAKDKVEVEVNTVQEVEVEARARDAEVR